jgi:phosphopantetheine adenylyltransferase
MSMIILLKEQLDEYSEQLKAVEKIIVRKYKAGEDFKKELQEANGLKALQEQTVLMMARYTK